MSPEGARRVDAVLDTSFWVLGYRAEILANCLDLFEIIVPTAVKDEIMAGDRLKPSREYPYATLFRQLEDKFKTPDVPVAPLRVFGAGEAEAIAVAKQLDAILLINESRGAQYARNQGVAVVTVPSVVVLLRSQGIISDRAARRKLLLISHNTDRAIMADAVRALDALGADDETVQ